MPSAPPTFNFPSPGSNTPEINLWVDAGAFRSIGAPAPGTTLAAFPDANLGRLDTATYGTWQFAGFTSASPDGQRLLANFLGPTPAVVKHESLGLSPLKVYVWFSPLRLASMAAPAIDAALSTFTWIESGARSTYGACKFKGFDEVERGKDGNHMRGVFATAADGLINQFDTARESYPWPHVLTALAFNHVERDTPGGSVPNISIGGATGNEYSWWNIQPVYKLPYQGITKIVVRDYVYADKQTAPTLLSPWDIRVWWKLSGRDGAGETPPCLTFGAITTPKCTFYGFSTETVPARTFPPTPTTDWTDHLCGWEQALNDGLWYVRTKTAIVPGTRLVMT